ncbi:MAG: guanylate kinase [Bacillota bacterium]|nr:guanylate kinase [Bacillota bacterium]
MKNQGTLIVFSGPSGVGKGSICRKLKTINPNAMVSVSATTRKPREGEVDGVDYFFLSREEFEQKIEENAFLEYSYHFGNYYGTPRAEVEKALERGHDVILEIETNGGALIREQGENAIFVFVLPPNLQELRRRIENRGSENKEEIVNRLKRAVKELDYINLYDYSIVNDDIDEAAEKLNMILNSARLRPWKYQDLLDEIRDDLLKEF